MSAKNSKNIATVERDERGRIKKGSVLNPGGRPRNAYSLTKTIQRRVDPEKVCKEIEDMAYDKSVSPTTRLAALKVLIEAGYKKPAQTVEVGPANPYEGYTDEELIEMLNQSRTVGALSGGEVEEPVDAEIVEDDAPVDTGKDR